VPAWTAGIQTRTDASGDIHVNLDSSTQGWNDAFESFCFDTDQRFSTATKFSMEHKEGTKEENIFFGFAVLSVIRSSCPWRAWS
jgi:hypothetical protein